MHIFLTGANRGIGLALARLYVGSGDTVYAACREVSPELESLSLHVLPRVDVTDRAALASLKAG